MEKYPKIGIHPTVDGRQGGVREGPGEGTVNLAKAVTRLIISNLKNGDGTPMECVIADGAIGRVAEGAACAEKFECEGVGATITVTSCWCYGAEAMDMNPYYPRAVWGFDGTERPGVVYLAVVLAGHAQEEFPTFGVYGHNVQNLDDNSIPADVVEKALCLARAVQTVTTMCGKFYLSMGGVSVGIADSIVNPDFFQEYLGMRNESIDLTGIIRRMAEGIYDKEEYVKAVAWAGKYYRKSRGNNLNTPEETKTRTQRDEDWEFIVKMITIMCGLMQGNPKLKELRFKEGALGHNTTTADFQGQRQWTDFYPNGDFSEALLNTSSDLSDIREAFVIVTENNACNGVAMPSGHLLTNRAQTLSDVHTYWSPEVAKRVTGKELTGMTANDIIHLINSGVTTLDGTGQQTNANGEPAMKPCQETVEGRVEKCLEAITWYLASRDYFRGDGFSSNFLSKGGMPATTIRLSLMKGLGLVLQITEGWAVEIDPRIYKLPDEHADRTWSIIWFALRLCDKSTFKDVYSVMSNWEVSHGATNYGHTRQGVITLAPIPRIPICMYNVEEDQVSHPAAWSAFGMDKEGADYRARTTYSPTHK